MTQSLSNPTDLMGPWTIKSVATIVRQRIVRHAEIAGLTVGQFIERMLEVWDDRPTIKVDVLPPEVLAKLLVRSAEDERLSLAQWLERHVPDWRADQGRTLLQTQSAPGTPPAPDYSTLERLERLAAIDHALLEDTVLQRRLRTYARRLANQLGKTPAQTRETPSDQNTQLALAHPEVHKWVEPC
jgi:hypothetical protein